MRFYPKGFVDLFEGVDALLRQSRLPADEQTLFLVQEVDNAHDVSAIMLHDGQQKIGSVAATDAPRIKMLLENTNDVIVCSMAYVPKRSEEEFRHQGSLKVHGRFIVHERLARKYSDQQVLKGR